MTLSPRRLVLPLTLVLLGLILAASAASARADTPRPGQLYANGPTSRYLLDGPWLFRLDDENKGIGSFEKQTSTSGWSPVTVPNAWNAGDDSEKSFLGSTGWYRKDFTLPSSSKSLSWIVRFESVNYRSRVWLNGKEIGQNTGAYLPFELKLATALKRTGTNRLVIRVDNHRTLDDFPPSGLSAKGAPTGGWWNYGGLLREVYLRKVDRVDLNDVHVRPILPCSSCDATVQFGTTVRNLSTSSQKVALTGRFGERTLSLGTVTVPGSSSKLVTGTLKLPDPKLWAPDSPYLYQASIAAKIGSTQVQRYDVKTGVRSIKVVNGRLLLNGRPLDVRGFGLHEDDPKLGFAITNQIRDRELDEAKSVGATILRAHYPLSPYTLEQADARGMMVWSEIPVYSLRTPELAKPNVRKDAVAEMARTVLTNQNHPSIIVWSVGNELSSNPGPAQGAYLTAAAKQAKALDPTRPVAYAVAGYPAAGCQPEYAAIDVLGINEYFGWYPGPNGQIADRDILPGFLDAVHECYPDKALLISEFGAEANRDGPVEEKGTYQFQQDFVNYHLGVYGTKPWLNGAIYWALEEFRVRPGWDGGNPRPTPPIHQKGIFPFGGGTPKPAFADLQRLFASVQQIGPPVPGR